MEAILVLKGLDIAVLTSGAKSNREYDKNRNKYLHFVSIVGLLTLKRLTFSSKYLKNPLNTKFMTFE